MNVYWNERQEANPTLMFGCDNQPRKVVAMDTLLLTASFVEQGLVYTYIRGTKRGIRDPSARGKSHDDHVSLQPLVAKDE